MDGCLETKWLIPLANTIIRPTDTTTATGSISLRDAGVQFARTEGILPAPEANHAIRAAVDEALEAKREGKPRVIVFNHCGHGHFDLTAYDRYLAGKLEDVECDTGKGKEARAALPGVG